MSCQCEPHRKMAADGARTENANPHGVEILLGGKGVASFHKPWSGRNRSAAQGGLRRARPWWRGNLVVQSTFIRVPSSL